MTATPLAEGWVLAGGRSRRMGEDKAALRISGVPLLEHMLGKIRALGLPARVAGLRAPVPGVEANVVADRHPECGPLGGLETALRSSTAPFVLAIAVDLPLVETAFLRWMLERAERTGATATIPSAVGEPQPLCAVYRRTLSSRVSEALESGAYKVMAAVTHPVPDGGADPETDLFSVERIFAAGLCEAALPAHLQFLNCNRREDVALVSTVLAEAPIL